MTNEEFSELIVKVFDTFCRSKYFPELIKVSKKHNLFSIHLKKSLKSNIKVTYNK